MPSPTARPPDAPRPWEIGVDTGGTFTDAIGISPEGTVHRAKVLSSAALRGAVEAVLSPTRLLVQQRWNTPPGLANGFRFGRPGASAAAVVLDHAIEGAETILTLDAAISVAPGDVFEVVSPEPAAVLAARLLTGAPTALPLPPLRMRLATTRGTNALLQRRGAPCALFITAGFGDLLEIGDGSRPELFTLNIHKPAPLYACVVEVPERMGATGEVIWPLDEAAVRAAATRLRQQGITSAAIALLHSFRWPQHEQQVAQILRECGMEWVAASAALTPTIRLLPRARTAVVEAYLAPVVATYINAVQAAGQASAAAHSQAADGGDAAAADMAQPDSRTLHILTSAGGLVRASEFHAKDSLLSGPAAGLVGAAAAAREAGFAAVLTFDMGGTSTDVARVGPAITASDNPVPVDRASTTGSEPAGSRETSPLPYVFEHGIGDVTLAAPALRIESVAAGGGSVCWFDGASLKVGPHSAGAAPGPACYGAGGPLTITDCHLLLGRLSPVDVGIPLDAAAARARLQELLDQLPGGSQPEAVLEGLLRIADERMADAIRTVSVREGYDPADHALLAFGGAGGLHACAIAQHLGIRTIILPRDAGILSARGLGAAALERFAEQQVLQLLPEAQAELPARLQTLEASARAAVTAEGTFSEGSIRVRRLAFLRLTGADTTLELNVTDPAGLGAQFSARYRQIYGYPPPDRPVEVEALRVLVSAQLPGALGREQHSGNAPISPADTADTEPTWGVPATGETEWARSLPATAASPVRTWLEDAWREVPLFQRDGLPAGGWFEGPALLSDQHCAFFAPDGWRCTHDESGAIIGRRLTTTPTGGAA